MNLSKAHANKIPVKIHIDIFCTNKNRSAIRRVKHFNSALAISDDLLWCIKRYIYDSTFDQKPKSHPPYHHNAHFLCVVRQNSSKPL